MNLLKPYSGTNTLEMKCVIESYYPAASASMPLPRKAAGTNYGVLVESEHI